MNVSTPYIAKIETGKQTGPVELAVEFAAFFDVSLDFSWWEKEILQRNRSADCGWRLTCEKKASHANPVKSHGIQLLFDILSWR